MTRVLIVDDKEENLRYLETLLNKHNFSVVSARNGAEALASARQHALDLVISDLLMPIMDGYTLLRHWKTDAQLKAVPFIVYTATFTDLDDRHFGENLGADAYLLKPAKIATFLDCVRQVLARASVAAPVSPPAAAPLDDDSTTLKYYSERLIRKLEDKTVELEHANRALQREISDHQRAEEKLRFNMAILQTQQQASLDAILVVSGDGRVLSYNERLLKLWDTTEELLESCRDVPLQRSATIMTEIGKALENPAAYLAKIQYLHEHPLETSLEEVRFKNGTIVEVYSAPAIGTDGQHYGRIWYYRDVSENRLAKASLEASIREQRQLTALLEVEHARLTAAQQIAKVGSWETDLATLNVIWSYEVHRIFETDPATFAPTHDAFIALVHPEDRARVQQAFVDSAGKLAANKVQHRLLLRDGKVKFVEENWRVYTDEHGQPLRALGTCLDITEQRLLLESLNEKAVQLSNAQRIGRMGSWNSDVRTGRLVWTDATCELFGIRPEAFEGTYAQLRSFILPEDLAVFDAAHARATPADPLLEMEFRIRRPDGSVRWLYARGNVEFDADGAAVSRAGMVMDVTEQRMVSAQLAQNTALLRIAGRLSKVGGWTVDVPAGRVYWSDDVCLLHEMPVGHSPTLDEALDFYPGEFREQLAAACAHCIDRGTPFDLELQLVTAGGRCMWVRVIGEALRNVDEKIHQIQGAMQDISEQKATAEKIHGLGKRLIDTLESISDGFFTIDSNWNFSYVNGRAEKLLLRSRGELLGRNIWEEFKEASPTQIRRNYERVVAEQTSIAFEDFYPPLNAWFEITAYPALDGLAVYFRDVTQRKETEAQLAYLRRVRAVLSGINALIVRATDRGQLFREACQIAYEAGEFRMVMLCIRNPATQVLEPVASEGKDEALIDIIRNTLASPETAAKTMVVRAMQTQQPIVANDSTSDARVLFGERYRASGVKSMAVLPLIVHGTSVGVLVLYARESGFFLKDEMSLLTELANDIAFAVDHIEKQERLDYLANYDTLTGLANRKLFLDRLRLRLPDATVAGRRVCVSLINIARFKNINDTLGRASGDVLLQLLAEYLIRNMGNADSLARIGADEFAAMFEVRPQGNLIKLFDHLHRILEDHSFAVNETTLRIAARSGIAIFPDDGADADTVLRNAEAALKGARIGNERFKFYTSDMNVAVASRLAMEIQLRRALGNGEFELYYQPKASLQHGRITGAEALIRWNHPEGNLVLPGQFIPVLEETGMIADVGHWALRKAVEHHRRWRSKGMPAVRIAVNVSPLQLTNHNFIRDLQHNSGLDPSSAVGLELEITEGVIMNDIVASTASLKAIRAMGITIAIDDFGTGFSSLGYLARLPVDSLKIDRSFVVDMTAGPEGLALVSTIIGLAHSLNLKVVAEGVETEEQLRLLRLLKCDEIQGYILSRPLPLAEFEGKFLAHDFKLLL